MEDIKMAYRVMSGWVGAVVLAGAVIFIAGCGDNQPEPDSGQPGAASVTKSAVPLCTKCGDIKGSPECCKADRPTCGKCGLVKGTPGCCKITKGAESAALCAKCGQIKGAEACCKPGQPTCDKCGLVKGAPGCCKLK